MSVCQLFGHDNLSLKCECCGKDENLFALNKGKPEKCQCFCHIFELFKAFILYCVFYLLIVQTLLSSKRIDNEFTCSMPYFCNEFSEMNYTIHH